MFTGPNIVKNGLVLWLDAANTKSYPGSGTTWRDMSGNNNSGSLVNGPSYNNQFLGSVSFDGVDDYATAPVTLSMSAFTISFWLYLQEDFTSRFDIFTGSAAPSTNGRFTFYQLNPTTLQSYIYSPTANTVTVNLTNANTLLTNKWAEISISFGDSNNGGSCKIYLNGLMVNSSNVPEAHTASQSALYLMRDRGIQYPTLGKVSELKAYNRVLTDNEVSQNFEAMRGRYGV